MKHAALVVGVAAGVIFAIAACGGAIAPTTSNDDSPGPLATATATTGTSPPAPTGTSTPLDASVADGSDAAPVYASGAPDQVRSSATPCMPTPGATGGGDPQDSDECLSDSDCPSSFGVCVCQVHSAYDELTINRCFTMDTCRTTADCAMGQYCGYSFVEDIPWGSSYLDGLSGYFCTTATDTCRVDADCVAEGLADQSCIYQYEEVRGGRWACGPKAPGTP